MPDEQRRRPGRTLAWVAVAVVVAGLAAWFWLEKRPPAAAPARGAGARVVPVVAATARLTDVPVYLDGLGTVTALNTVTVRSRVDGQLDERELPRGPARRARATCWPRSTRARSRCSCCRRRPSWRKDEATLEERAARPGALPGAAGAGRDPAPAARHAAGARCDQLEATLKSDRGAGRERAAQPHLLPHHGADRRARRPAAGRPGQHGARQRPERAGRHHPAAADRGRLHDRRRQPPAGDRADAARPASSRSRPGTATCAKRLATGTLRAIDNQIDTTTGTVRLKAVFANEDDALFPNQFVNARLLVDTLHERRHRADGGAAAQPPGDLRLRREARRHGRDAQRRGAAHRGRRLRDRRAASPRATIVVIDGVDKLQPGTKVRLGRRRAGNRPAGRPRASGEGDPDEPVAPVHPAADRDLAADGGAAARGRRRLPAAAGLGAAAGRLPDDPGGHVLSRRQPRRDGLVGHRAARAAVRPGARA